MAKLKIVAILDLKVSAFVMPHFSRSTGEALREFAAAAEDSKSQISRFPGDFQLMELGEFDDQMGLVSSLAKPLLLGLASEYVKKPSGVTPIEAAISAAKG